MENWIKTEFLVYEEYSCTEIQKLSMNTFVSCLIFTIPVTGKPILLHIISKKYQTKFLQNVFEPNYNPLYLIMENNNL